MKNCLVLVLSLLCFQKGFCQSDFSVPYQSLLAINPSFAGSNGFIRNQSSFNFPSSVSTSNFFSAQNTFDVYSSNLKSGFGVSLMYSERDYNFQKTSGALSYSKYFELGDQFKLVPSLQVSYSIKETYLGFSPAALPVVPNSNPGWTNTSYMSLNSGLLANYKSVYVGASIFNMNRPDVGVFATERAPVLINLHASYNWFLSKNVLIHLHAQTTLEEYLQTSLLSLNMLFLKKLIYGLSVQPNQSFSSNVGFRTNYFTMQACYTKTFDASENNLNSGAWTIMAAVTIRTKDKQTLVTNFEAW